MSVARRYLEIVTATERAICLLAFTVMSVAVFADVAARSITGHGLVGMLQIGVLGMILSAFVGAGLASSAGGHLRPRILDRLTPPALEGAVVRVGEGLTALACGTFAGLTAFMTLETRTLGDVNPVLNLIVWPVQAVLPLAFASLAVRHAIYALRPDLRPAERGDG